MKNTVLGITLALTIVSSACNAQTWNEWFKQKKTQKAYLAQQIAALHVYLDYLKKGYSIARKGLNTIENIKNGHFALDRDFFSSLKEVNPAIRNSVRVADIIAFEIFISRELAKTYRHCATNNTFTADEVRYVSKVHSNMLLLTDASVSEFISIIKPGDMSLTDDERMSRLNGIYNDLQNKCAFVMDFSNDVRLISMSRDRSLREVEVSQAHSRSI